MRSKNGLLAAALGCAMAIALLGCADDSQPIPSVNLTSSETTVALGQRVTLAWTTQHASGCSAEGDWSGSKAPTGSESVAVPLTQARSTFGLACTRGSRKAHAEVVVTIAAPRFAMEKLPLGVAGDLNDAGDVLAMTSMTIRRVDKGWRAARRRRRALVPSGWHHGTMVGMGSRTEQHANRPGEGPLGSQHRQHMPGRPGQSTAAGRRTSNLRATRNERLLAGRWAWLLGNQLGVPPPLKERCSSGRAWRRSCSRSPAKSQRNGHQ